jgi:tetratricopeptide (TPR) repeat protein
MNHIHLFSTTLTGAALVMFLPQVAIALPVDEIRQIAAAVTVLIDGLNPGSGVIVARNGNTYTVLTAKHVVATEDEYAIVTPDGQSYDLAYNTVTPLPGVDLALLQFSSDRSYQVATLANYTYDNQFRHVFVSGWVNAYGGNPQTALRVSAGLLMRKTYALAYAQDAASRGYELLYTSLTSVGMSGGPVLDSDGRVIGIHGRSEGEEIYDQATGQSQRLSLGFSSGIPIQTFLQLVPQTGISNRWHVQTQFPNPLTPTELATMNAALQVPPVSSQMTAIDWANRGNQFYRLERFTEALLAFDQAIALQPDFHQAWYGKAQVLSTQGDYENALESFNQVLQLQPNFPTLWRDRALVYVLIGQSEAAVADFDRAVLQTPEDYVAWYLRGNLFRRLGWLEAALGSYDRAIQISPEFAEAYVDRGRTLAESQQPEAALRSLNQAIELDPQLATAWYWRARVLLDSQQPEVALTSVEQAIALLPANDQFWSLRGGVLSALARYDEAYAAAQRALELNAENREAIDLLNALP